MASKIFLGLTALMFFAFGGWSITDPAGMTAQLGVDIGGVSGLFEMRGVYGGVSLGIGALCALASFRERFIFAALCAVSAYMGGYVIGRAGSLIAGDTALSSNWFFAGYELIMFVIATSLAFRKG